MNVFEERYKLMVRRCLQGSRRFGMVGLIRDENDARRDDREPAAGRSLLLRRRLPATEPHGRVPNDDDDMTERARSP